MSRADLARIEQAVMSAQLTPSARRASGPDGGARRPARGLPLGQWAGVPVNAHWSALVTLLLFADLLARAVLPTASPHHGVGAYWLAGSLTAVLLLGSLLAHEAAHAVTARHYGMTVRGISLWMLGGMTDLGGQPPTPRADGLVAAVGPATSMCVGALTAGVASWVGPGLVGVSLAWLGSANLLLGGFNLLPGAPLDGGRVLRALLWARSHDRARAEATAAAAGRFLGVMLIVIGAVDLLAGMPAALWMMLLGWFIVQAADGEEEAQRVSRLHGIRASEIMSAGAVAAPDWWTVEQFLERLTVQAATQPAFPLVDISGRTSGVLTLTDLEAVPVAERGTRRLGRVATRRRVGPLVVSGEADVGELAARLSLHGGVAVVVDDGRPIGTLTSVDVMRAARLTGFGGHSAPSGRG